MTGSEGLLAAIKKALDGPPGSVTHVDIIHHETCDVHLEGDELFCTCEPEYQERRTN